MGAGACQYHIPISLLCNKLECIDYDTINNVEYSTYIYIYKFILKYLSLLMSARYCLERVRIELKDKRTELLLCCCYSKFHALCNQLSDDRITRETWSNSNTVRALFFCPLILLYIYIYIYIYRLSKVSLYTFL